MPLTFAYLPVALVSVVMFDAPYSRWNRMSIIETASAPKTHRSEFHAGAGARVFQGPRRPPVSIPAGYPKEWDAYVCFSAVSLRPLSTGPQLSLAIFSASSLVGLLSCVSVKV